MRRPQPESGDKAATPEPPGSDPKQPRPHSPLLRGLNPWAPPSRSAPTTVRPCPRAAARARPPAQLRCPSATAPRPGSARRPWARAPRATAAGAGSFSAAAAALRPLPPDVRRGGSTEVGGGPRRPAPEGAATRTPTRSPPGGSDPRPSPCPAAPRLAAVSCATAPGGGAGEGLRALARGESDSPGLSEVSPKANRAGWASGLGNGAKGIPTLRLLERRRAGHLRASIRGFFSGRIRVVCLLAPNSSSFLGPNSY